MASDGSERGDVTTASLSAAPQLVGSEIYHEREDGHESSFEEARLSRWKIPHHAVNENSPRSSAEKAMLIEKSLNMFQSKSGRQNSEELSPSSDKEPADKSSMSRVSSLSSMDEPPAFFCTMPSSQFSVNGEETMAIKKYAEELITHGADPNAQADIGGHQGLIDQTINTKECLSDILSMFNRPLACEKPQRKVRATIKDRAAFEIFNDDENEPKQVPSGNKDFEVFVDEETSATPPARMKKPASRKPFQILHDEEFAMPADDEDDAMPAPRNVDRRIPKNKPVSRPQNNGFSIFVDDDMAGQSQPVRKPKLASSSTRR